MKQFNLKAALSGAPVVTVSGYPVTGLHWFAGVENGTCCLAGVCGGAIETWREDGMYFSYINDTSPLDLRMADDNQAHDQGE